MANDVEIVVSASLGDTLVKLDLAKRAVKDLGDQSAETAAKEDVAAAATNNLGSRMGFLTGNWKMLIPVIAAATGGILAFTGNLGVLLPLVPVLTVFLAALLAPFTSLAAILVALAGPINFIIGSLSLLAVGFGLAAKQAFGKGGTLADSLSHLQHEFHGLIGTLAHDFMPVFTFLITSASQAIHYFDKLAHMNLKDAFKSLATTGVAGLERFIEKIGHFVANPIRLAFDFAFGQGGKDASGALGRIWTHILDFFRKPPPGGGASIDTLISRWFGRHDFTKTGMRWGMELAGSIFDALGSAFQHLMMSQGGKMLLGGMGAGAAIGAFGGPIGALIGAAIGAAIGITLNHYWPRIKEAALSAWKSISTDAIRVFHQITTALEHFLGPATWHRIGNIAKNVWQIIRTIAVNTFHTIVAVGKEVWKVFDTLIIKTGLWKGAVGIVKAAIYLVVAVVNLIIEAVKKVLGPVLHLSGIVGGALLGAFNAVLGVVGSIVGGISTAIGYAQSLASALNINTPTGAQGGRYGINPPAKPGSPSGHLASNLSGGMVNHFHFHGTDPATFSRHVRSIGQELARQQARLADG